MELNHAIPSGQRLYLHIDKRVPLLQQQHVSAFKETYCAKKPLQRIFLFKFGDVSLNEIHKNLGLGPETFL